MRGIIVIDDKAIEEKIRLIEDKLVEVHILRSVLRSLFVMMKYILVV